MPGNEDARCSHGYMTRVAGCQVRDGVEKDDITADPHCSRTMAKSFKWTYLREPAACLNDLSPAGCARMTR
jgi:hypothetical protein